MRTLSATLAAAQKLPVRQEIINCKIVDAPVEWPRWTWTSIYANADPDAPHAVVQLSSGALVRARQVAGGVDTQKIADPTNAAQWQAWTSWKAAGTTQSGPGIALASSDQADALRLFYVDA